MILRTLSFVLLLLQAGAASAQVYKIAGPDGKITYSDRPPVEASSSVQLIKSGGPVPVGPEKLTAAEVAAATAAQTAAPRAGAMAGAPREAMGGAKRAAASSKAQLLPGLAAVLGNSALTDQAVDLCNQTLPTSMKRYEAGKTAWRSRNRDVLSKTDALLSSEFSGSERAALEQTARTMTTSMLATIRSADVHRRITWCDKTADEMASGAVDLDKSPSVQALMRYPGR